MNGQQPEPRPPLPVLGSPRSPVWRWFLGTSSAAAYALITGLLSGLVLSTFSNSRIGQFVGTTLGGISWVVLAGSAAYVVLRIGSGIRERRVVARELALTADLVVPGPKVAVDAPTPVPSFDRPGELIEQCHLLLQAIDWLDVKEFDVDALLAVHAALVEAQDRLPARTSVGDRDSAVHVLNLLVARGFLERTSSGRLSRTDTAGSSKPADETVLVTARTALLQHYADLAVRWSKALDTTAFAQGAARWFELEEEYLRELIRLHPAEEPRRSELVELFRIADALDVWYARTDQPDEQQEVARQLRDLVPEDTFPMLHSVARVRAGDLAEPQTGFGPRRLEATVDARRVQHKALEDLTAALRPNATDRAGALADVEERLERVWWNLARHDVAGEVCALINLAVVHLYQGRLEAAQDRLELAESLTATGRDPAGRAHALEMRGIVCWAQGTPPEAIAYWQRSLRLYRELGEVQSEARCLQHLGSALAVAPSLGGLLISPPSDGRLDTAAVSRHAGRLLRGSQSLRRPGGAGCSLADEYLKSLATADDGEPSEAGSADVPVAEPERPAGLFRQVWRWIFG